jgi:RNA ligase (TIGR02306 family)
MERKLATVQRIDEINPIPDADNIEVASIKGWKVVIRKGEFKVGDLCVYIEIDSILPDWPEFAFLKDKNVPTRPIRLRTARLRKQISQGLALSLNILESHSHPITFLDEDVTEILQIIKYEPDTGTHLGGPTRGNFPPFLRKTDEERIQNMKYVLDQFKDTVFYVTEKIDGTSSTYYYRYGEIGVCSRNLDLKPAETAYWEIVKKYDFEKTFKTINRSLALQGEIVGEGICKNKYHLKGHEFYLFSVFDIDAQKYVDLKEMLLIAAQFGVKTVPILSVDYRLPPTIDEILKYADDKSQLYPQGLREGVVIRPIAETINPHTNDRLSFKVINNSFLLKNKDD